MSKKVEMSEKQKRLEAIRSTVNKKFGSDETMMLAGAQPKAIEATSTGSMQLDLALGVGGVPNGRILEVYGPEASGKTTLALHVAAETQRKGGTVAFIDAEHALDPNYAKAIGVKMDELLIAQPESGNQALEITDMLMGEVDLVIIDSVAALTPIEELEGSMEDMQMGAQARMMSKGLRKIVGKAGRSKTTVLCINQIRMKIGFVLGNPETTPGGNALKYAASLRLEIRRGKSTTGDVSTHGVMRVKIVKNKVATPFKSVEVPIIFGKGIDQVGEVYQIAKEAVELIETGGGTHYYVGEPVTLSDGTKLMGGEKSAENKFASKRVDALELLEKDPIFYESLRKQVRERLDMLLAGKTWKKPVEEASKEDSSEGSEE
jgi:recombination protein RecA